MARSTPPSLVSYTEIPYNSTGTPVSASISWLAGDLVLVIAANENTLDAIGLATATGLTFASAISNTTGSTCAGRVMTATAAAGGSSAVAVALTTGARMGGAGIWVWRGSEGFGSVVEQHTATRTKALVPVDTHSAYCWTVADFNAGVTTSVTLTPTATTTQESAQQASHYTVYSGNLNDQASSGSTNFGTTGGTVTGPSTIVAQEILGRNVSPVTTVPMRAARN